MIWLLEVTIEHQAMRIYRPKVEFLTWRGFVRVSSTSNRRTVFFTGRWLSGG